MYIQAVRDTLQQQYGLKPEPGQVEMRPPHVTSGSFPTRAEAEAHLKKIQGLLPQEVEVTRALTDNDPPVWVLAVDIETSGSRPEHSVLAIGAAVLDDQFTTIDTFLYRGYVPDRTKFDARCLRESWSQPEQQATLKQLVYRGQVPIERVPVPPDEVPSDMINRFRQFMGLMEMEAQKAGAKLEVVTDNAGFDLRLLSREIYKYIPDDEGMQFTVTTKKFRPTFETWSQQRGLLMAVDPSFQSDYGLTERIDALYDVPKRAVVHDHLPHHGAYSIAFDQQVLHGIQRGTILRRRQRK